MIFTREELSKMTVQNLQYLARGMNLSGFYRLNKKPLIELIFANQEILISKKQSPFEEKKQSPQKEKPIEDKIIQRRRSKKEIPQEEKVKIGKPRPVMQLSPSKRDIISTLPEDILFKISEYLPKKSQETFLRRTSKTIKRKTSNVNTLMDQGREELLEMIERKMKEDKQIVKKRSMFRQEISFLVDLRNTLYEYLSEEVFPLSFHYIGKREFFSSVIKDFSKAKFDDKVLAFILLFLLGGDEYKQYKNYLLHIDIESDGTILFDFLVASIYLTKDKELIKKYHSQHVTTPFPAIAANLVGEEIPKMTSKEDIEIANKLKSYKYSSDLARLL